MYTLLGEMDVFFYGLKKRIRWILALVFIESTVLLVLLVNWLAELLCGGK